MVLAEIQSLVNKIYNDPHCPFNNNPPILRMISPLAEVSDRLLARNALDSGFELQCPLPFHREEYEKDFSTRESIQDFNDLLEQASAVLELDENREAGREGECYLSAGRVVLHQSDILLAVWNGKEAQGKGGTGNIAEEGRSLGIPVIWIKSYAPFDIVMMEEERLGWKEEIEDYLTSILNPFEGGDIPSPYFFETHPSNNYGVLYKMFKDLFANYKIKPSSI